MITTQRVSFLQFDVELIIPTILELFLVTIRKLKKLEKFFKAMNFICVDERWVQILAVLRNDLMHLTLKENETKSKITDKKKLEKKLEKIIIGYFDVLRFIFFIKDSTEIPISS